MSSSDGSSSDNSSEEQEEDEEQEELGEEVESEDESLEAEESDEEAEYDAGEKVEERETGINDGTCLIVTSESAGVFLSAASHETSKSLAVGTKITASGPLAYVDGWNMVPIRLPVIGAVRLCCVFVDEVKLACDVSYKLDQCFDQDGFTVTVTVKHVRARQQTSASDGIGSKVQRILGKTAEFKIWSTLLSQWSDVFRVMLKGGMRESEGLIEIIDFSPEAVGICLRFMYSGKVQVPIDSLIELAMLADKYAVRGGVVPGGSRHKDMVVFPGTQWSSELRERMV